MQPLVIVLTSINRLSSLGDVELLPNGSLRAIELVNLLVLPPVSVLALFLLLEHLIDGVAADTKRALRLAFLAALTSSPPAVMEGDSGGAAAAHGCKCAVSTDRAPADAWSSSGAGASVRLLDDSSFASKRERTRWLRLASGPQRVLRTG